MTCKNESTTQDKIYVFSGSCLRSLRCTILLHIPYIYIVCWDVLIFFGYHTSHTSQFSLFSLSRVCIADLRTQGFLSENCGFGGPLASEITAFGGMLSFWSNVSHTQFLVFNFDRYSCCGVARWHHGFVLRKKRHAEKSQKTQLWMKMVKHSTSTWPSKIQAFVFINSSENKLGTLHVVELFSSISVDLQAQWQLQLDTSALVPGHDGQSMSLVLNLCYNSALRALQVFFFTFVFCCQCLHPFCLFETRFVIVLSDLDSGQHYKLCLDMDGVSTALLPGQHSTQELRSEFCFFQYLKFKVFFPKIVFCLLKIVFFHNSHIFQACLSH